MSDQIAVKEKKNISTNRIKPTQLKEHIVEIVSDSGEGAQKCGQSFGSICAKMGNGVWTVEIIPAEIQPPPRMETGASGNRIRFGSFYVTNAGDKADLVVAFNEQVLKGRINAGSIKHGATILIENMWRTHGDPSISSTYQEAYDQLVKDGFNVIEIPMEEECLKYVLNPRRGKNMFVLGILCAIYRRDVDIARAQVKFNFFKKGEKIISDNIKLFDAGYEWAEDNIGFFYEIPANKITDPQIVVNGNIAIALGIMASGMETCAMYPITPATSASHYLTEIFENVGGVVHQAEDEISACAFAIGSSYAGKCACTITSGPGMALKTELIGLASMAEIPLVIVNVQRGGPSTGLPTKVEQGDLLAAIFATHGDAPKIVFAVSNVEDCFYSVITARQIAETFRMPVIILSDANLATGQQPIKRPKLKKEWLAPAIDQSPVPENTVPYDWDEITGLSKRFIPGQAGGMHTLTGLAHNKKSLVAYEPAANQEGVNKRSLKLAAFQKTLKTPKVFGNKEGDLLVIGWGSTEGANMEAVARTRDEGLNVSYLHLKFLQPMASGIKEILQNYKKVIAVEINYSDSFDDEIITEDNRRYSNLAWLLRARYLVDIDCWSNVHGQPFMPGDIAEMIRNECKKLTVK